MTSLGSRFDLKRFPETRNSSLVAWDAADEYALDHLAEVQPPGWRWLILNDSFGALSVALAEREPTSISDSVLAIQAARRNLGANGVRMAAVQFVPSTEPVAGEFDVVLIKVPKTLAFLEDQLHQLRPHLTPATVIVGAGMVKHIHTSTLQLFQQILGQTTTSLAKKKARLIHTTLDPSLAVGNSPGPARYVTPSGLVAVNHANVFSQTKLDLGTRLLLEHLPQISDRSTVVDLGCGNGLLGTAAAANFAGGSVVFTDSSFQALASAEATWKANRRHDARPSFLATNTLDGVPEGSVNLVLNNPPFHDIHVTGDETAWRMFTESHRVLRPGGELLVVGNRHLGYHIKLQRIFKNCETVAANAKFVVLAATRDT